MRIDPAWADRTMGGHPRYVFGILTRHADAELERLVGDSTARGQVEQVLLQSLHRGRIGIAVVARRLGLSRDTLYRRLRDEGTTFRAIVDQLRCKLALDYLAARKISVNETACLLGFSDPAAFSRAFKRWTGKSPRVVQPARTAG